MLLDFCAYWQRAHSRERLASTAGLPPAFWQSEKGPSAAAALPSDPGNLQGSSGKGLSDLQDHRAHAGHPAKSATLGLLQEPVDAIIYAKVPGPWPAQGIRKS